MADMFQLRDLLSQAVKRAHVSTQVSASQIVVMADALLEELMGAKKKDARVVSFHEGILLIETLHSAASNFIQERETILQARLRERFTDHQVSVVRYRIVHHFRKSEL